MKNIKITAKYKAWIKDSFEDDTSTDGIYKVRELHESHTGKKTVHLWGWRSSVGIEEVDLLINGVAVNWID